MAGQQAVTKCRDRVKPEPPDRKAEGFFFGNKPTCFVLHGCNLVSMKTKTNYRLTPQQKKHLIDRWQAGCRKLSTLGGEVDKSYVAVRNFLKKEGLYEEQDAGALRRTKTLNVDAFAGEVTPEMAYWLGLLMADGCITESSLEITLQEQDKYIIEQFREWLGSSHKISYRDKVNAFRLGIKNKKLCADIIEKGVTTTKTKDATPPSDLRDNIHFWRGFVDGDGSLYNETKNGFTFNVVGTVGMIKGFCSFVFKHTGVNCKLADNASGVYYAYTSGETAVKIARLLYDVEGPCLKRKKEIALGVYEKGGKVRPAYRNWYSESDASKSFQALCDLSLGQPEESFIIDRVDGVKKNAKVLTSNLAGYAAAGFFSHRFRAHAQRKGHEAPVDALNKKGLELLEKVDGGRYKSITEAWRRNSSWAGQFPPAAAKQIYEIFKPQVVLDWCAGWGDRMAAAGAAGVRLFHAVDPHIKIHDCYRKVAKMAEQKGMHTCLYTTPWEETKVIKEVDMAFTSPPFFDIEQYCLDENQCYRRYPEKNQWINEWLVPSIKKAMQSVRAGGVCAVHMSNPTFRRKRIDIVSSMLEQLPLYSDIYYLPTREAEGEPIFVWQM